MRYRTIWLSDIHLGTSGCQAEKLLDFLRTVDSDYLILVGDIIDFWAMGRRPNWTTTHNTIVQKILKKSRHGTKVIYIPGNHDEILREYVGLELGNIELHLDYTHTLADGRTFFCVHGDDYDIVTRYHKWIAKLGDVGYEFLLLCNRTLNSMRAKFGYVHWSLSAFVKHRIKQAVSFISGYEESIIHETRKRGTSGVIAGHIHHAEIRQIENFTYANCGDWVESCTAIVEHYDGKLELLNWNNNEKNLDRK